MRRTKPISCNSLRVGKATAGMGLFATAPIEPGMYIEYIGDLISTEEANKKKGARYLFEINKHWTIDGATRTNLARYINYSCDPNCESVQTDTRVFIKAIRPIGIGEELTYDYGEEYVNEFIKPHGCRCATCIATPLP
ncbi:MAG: SET domain-containing protein [Candidatus Pacebacteria bacterium]|nr:SET domain-containing protein [Candidatus Paceibacterota bacterium]